VKIAVVAHAKKKLGGGLAELRAELGRRGQTEVGWHEVMKSKKVPDAVHAALATDPDLLLLWGGDGTVQRTLDTVARRKTPDVPIAVLPAGTSNLFASNFDIPHELSGALDVAFGGVRKRIDVGSFNGERFGVMAGVGFDALMIGDASRRMKDRLGRAAYVYTGLKNLRRAAVNAEVCVDDRQWFTGSTP
jgi:diacylglycerol kinase family enzyme